jgi:hypothetical protein
LAFDTTRYDGIATLRAGAQRIGPFSYEHTPQQASSGQPVREGLAFQKRVSGLL